MSHVERLSLKPGDTVVYHDDHGNRQIAIVKYPPWQLTNGIWLIGLHGIAGGYMLSRVVSKE